MNELTIGNQPAKQPASQLTNQPTNAKTIENKMYIYQPTNLMLSFYCLSYNFL